MAQFRISAAKGVEEVLQKIGREGARNLANELDNIVEANAVKIANNAKDGAPVKTGRLRRSINVFDGDRKMARQVGSEVSYAKKQEYENRTHKGFFRKAVWKQREPFRAAIQNEIRKHGR